MTIKSSDNLKIDMNIRMTIHTIYSILWKIVFMGIGNHLESLVRDISLHPLAGSNKHCSSYPQISICMHIVYIYIWRCLERYTTHHIICFFVFIYHFDYLFAQKSLYIDIFVYVVQIHIYIYIDILIPNSQNLSK